MLIELRGEYVVLRMKISFQSMMTVLVVAKAATIMPTPILTTKTIAGVHARTSETQPWVR